MTANTKTTWSVWGILFGMAIVLGIGVSSIYFNQKIHRFLVFFKYEKITVPQ